MSFLSAFNTSVSGMTAQRQRVNTISENIANAETTRTPQGGPYRRREVILASVANDRTFEEELLSQDRSISTSTEVKVVGIVQDTPYRNQVIQIFNTLTARIIQALCQMQSMTKIFCLFR